jgi:hypothetical protein
MEEAYKNYLDKSDLKDTTSTKHAFEAGWKAHQEQAPSETSEVPPDLNR